MIQMPIIDPGAFPRRGDKTSVIRDSTLEVFRITSHQSLFLNIAIQGELVGVRPQIDGINLVLPLVA